MPVAAEQVERQLHRGEVLVAVIGLAEPERDVRAGEAEPVPLEALAKLLAVAEVAGRPQLGALVARLRDRREHLLRPGHVREDADRDLERPVADRRIGDADHRRGSSVATGGPTRARSARNSPSSSGTDGSSRSSERAVSRASRLVS